MSETELLERPERLETENLRLKRVGIATLLGISSMLLLAVAHPPVQRVAPGLQTERHKKPKRLARPG